MMHHLLYNTMLPLKGLYHFFASFIFSAGAPANLCHQLKTALVPAEVRIVQHEVGIQNSNGAYVIKVQSLRYHLRTHEYIRSSFFKVIYDLPVCMAASCCVIIQTGNDFVRKKNRKLLLYLLRSKTINPE